MVRSMSCCGIKELTEVSFYDSPEDYLTHLCRYTGTYWGPAPAFNKNNFTCGAFLFTQAGANSVYGDRLAEYIRHERLGTVEELSVFRNRNTGRNIKTFLWKFNLAGLKRWHAAR